MMMKWLLSNVGVGNETAAVDVPRLCRHAVVRLHVISLLSRSESVTVLCDRHIQHLARLVMRFSDPSQ